RREWQCDRRDPGTPAEPPFRPPLPPRAGMPPATGTGCGSPPARRRALAADRKSLSRFDHRHLRDVDRAAAESAFAIHEIVAPELMERLLETLERAARDGKVIALAPALQSFGIIEPESVAVLP